MANRSTSKSFRGSGVGFGPGEPLVRPFPRVFPDVAGVVGGVVAESTPQGLGAMPERLNVYGAESELPVAELAVPVAAAAGRRQRHGSRRRHAHRRRPTG